MALSGEDDTTPLATQSTGNNVSVVAHVENLIDIDSHSELILETPPPDVVDSINECFKQFTSTAEERSDANVTVHQPPSDSDSDESLFMTQSRTKAVQSKRQLETSERPESNSDDSGHRRETEDTENRRTEEQQAKSPVITKKAFFARRANFPFQSKSLKRRHIPLRKHQILENSEMGGFLKCIWKIEENCVKTERVISPSLLESELSDNTEGDDDNSDHEVTQVDRIFFVPSYLKRHKQQWLPQSFLEMRNEAQARSSVKSKEILTACSNAEHLLTSKQKKKKKHKLKAQESFADTHSANNVHSAEMDQVSESQTEMTLKKTKKKRKDKERTKMAHLQPEHIHTSKKISGLKSDRKKKYGGGESQCQSVDFAVDVNSVSQFHDVTNRLTPQETVEERPKDVLEHTQAEFNNAEHSDSVQCAENLLGDNLSVIEDGQRNSVTAVTEQAVEHEDDLMSDNNLPNKSSNLLPPQGGDISIQDDIQQMDSDFGSQDLFRSLNSQELEDNQIHKTASITANTEKSDQDSDVTQIETEGQFVSIFGPGTPRRCDGDRHTYENSDSDETQIETEENSVSVFGSGTPHKQFTSQHMNSAKHPESQKTDQTPVSLNEKRKTVLRSHKDSDGTDVQETMNVQPSSEHLPLAGEPLEETCSISSERLNLSKRRAMEEIETNTQETPLFKNGGLSFIKRKTKIKKKLCATDCDLNVGVRSESPVDDITGVKTAPRENKKNGVMNEEQREALVLHVEETSENLEENVEDNSAITKVKRIKKKKHKLKEHEDVEPSVENQSVKSSQFSESQTAEIISKITKRKKRKDVPSNQTLDTDRPAELRVNDQSSEVPEMNEPECIQTSEEVTGCLMTNVTTLKPVKKKKKKKKRDETEESVCLDVSSMSQLDLVDGVVEQQVTDERPIDYNTAKHLDGFLKAAKCNKKGSSSDGIIGLKKQVSDSQSESTEVVLEKKTKKKQKIKKQKNAELASDDFSSEDLFRPMNSQELEDNQIHKTASITANMEKSDQDSDVTQIETEEHYVSIFGPGTPRWCDGDCHTYENSDSDETQIETEENSVSVFGSGTPHKHFTSQHMNSAKHPKSQNTDQTPVGLNKKRKTVLRSHKDSDGTDVQETMNVQPSSEHGCLMTNVTTLKPVKKKKKKKRDETEESVHLDLSSMSQLDLVDGVVEQQVIEERPIDYNTAKHLDGFLKAAKCKKKGFSSDGIIGLKKQASDSQSESTEVVLEKKTKKKQKLKAQKNAELASDIGDNVNLFQQSESPTTDSPSRKTKKKRANKDRERTTDCSSNEVFAQMCDRPLEMRGNNVIHSNEATKINQFEHLQASEEITRCSSPSVTKLSSGKKKKKKKDRSENHQHDSGDVNLDVSQLDVVSGLMGQNMMERRPSIGSAVEGNAEHMLKVAKRKKKRRNTSSLSQADDIIGLENTVSENMVEHVGASKQKKKKKHKLLKGQEEAESGADNVHSVEMDQFSESRTTEMTLKRTKKKRKDKGRKNTAHLEDNSGIEILSNETCEAPETELPEHTSEKISGLKSERKKKKKKNSSEGSQYVSHFDDVTDRSTFQETVEERLSDVLEHTQAELGDTKHKKKRKQPSLSVNNGSEFSSSKAEMQETVAPERKRKKKKL